jgi:hypothetical protein
MFGRMREIGGASARARLSAGVTFVE